jgi:hypothetical protein
MSGAHFHNPHRPKDDVREEFEPGASHVEPDGRPVSTRVSDGPSTSATLTLLRT